MNAKAKLTTITALLTALVLTGCGVGFRTSEEKKEKTANAMLVSASDPNTLLTLAALQNAEVKAMVDDPAVKTTLTVESTFGLNLSGLKSSGELSGQASVLLIGIKVRSAAKEVHVVVQSSRADLSFSASPAPTITGYFTIDRPNFPVYIGINATIVGNQLPVRLQGKFLGNLDNSAEAKAIADIDTPLCWATTDTAFLAGIPNLSGLNCYQEYEAQQAYDP